MVAEAGDQSRRSGGMISSKIRPFYHIFPTDSKRFFGRRPSVGPIINA
jgi:hypothetical protein